ncbi:murein transglycosylase A [Novosphingobium sp.]|uniref:murein transglycosylase A n=1 Tax=Novosphingobium sp. TaxID=1874826 RepID=UPI0035AFB020
MALARLRSLAALSLLIVLGSCGRIIPAPAGPPPAPPPLATALLTGVSGGPAVGRLGIDGKDAEGALASFKESCPRLVTRPDVSGLTRPEDWKPACDAAAKWPAAQAVRFFETWFESVQVGDGQGFVTGYYEPEIAGVRTRQPGFDVPVYALPPDLVRAKPGDAEPLPGGQMPLGRYDQTGKFVPYPDRAAIDDGALMGRGLEIGWAADPIEFFFLQIQGSGRLRAPDGTVMRIGYAGQNGYPFSGIGTLMRQRGLIGNGPGQYPGSMQGMMRYLREHPEEGRALMRQNQSYVFFRELTGDGPVGALGVPVRASASAAVDPAFVPLGAPVWLALDRTDASGLWIAQDTGGAIKGANRFDSFWGAGAEARRIAGGMSAHGQALLLLPKGTLNRLRAH